MKQTLLIILLLITISCISQVKKDSLKTRLDSESQNKNSSNYLERIVFKVGGGLFIPQGNLNTYFGVAPLIELNANFPIKEEKSIELALQFVIPNQKQNFLYLRTIDTLQVKSKMMINLFINLKKKLYSKHNSTIDISLGIGGSTIRTDARNPSYTGKKDEEKYEMVSSLLISPGVNWHHQFSRKTKITFSLNLQYSPYKVEGSLREDIGASGIIPKILFTF